MGIFDPTVRSLGARDGRSLSGDTVKQSLDHLRRGKSALSDAMAHLGADALLPLMRETYNSRMLRLTRAQVREIDRRSIEDYHIPGIVLMENAARAVMKTAVQMLEIKPGRVLIICGTGNNGGDGFAAARLLHEWGCEVNVGYPDSGMQKSGDAWENFCRIPRNMLATVATHAKIRRAKCDLIIDAILGTGLSGPPRMRAGELIDAINTRNLPVLSVDIPSGMDCDTGKPLGPCIRAAKTITFVAEKAGFANPESKQYTGEVIVGEIGCPRELIADVAAGDKG